MLLPWATSGTRNALRRCCHAAGGSGRLLGSRAAGGQLRGAHGEARLGGGESEQQPLRPGREVRPPGGGHRHAVASVMPDRRNREAPEHRVAAGGRRNGWWGGILA